MIILKFNTKTWIIAVLWKAICRSLFPSYIYIYFPYPFETPVYENTCQTPRHEKSYRNILSTFLKQRKLFPLITCKLESHKKILRKVFTVITLKMLLLPKSISRDNSLITNPVEIANTFVHLFKRRNKAKHQPFLQKLPWLFCGKTDKSFCLPPANKQEIKK